MHVRNKYQVARTERKDQCCILLRLKIQQTLRANHTSYKLLCEWLHIFVGRANFGLLSFCEIAASCVNARRHATVALANSIYLLALLRSYRHVLPLLLCAGLIAPCCAVFAVDARRQNARI